MNKKEAIKVAAAVLITLALANRLKALPVLNKIPSL